MRFTSLASIFAAAVVAGCSSTPSGSLTASPGSAGATTTASAPTGGGASDRMCNADSVMNIVGKPLNDRAANDAQQRAGAATLRLMRPGQVMTMEYNPRRLTVVVDDKNVVSSVRCG